MAHNAAGHLLDRRLLNELRAPEHARQAARTSKFGTPALELTLGTRRICRAAKREQKPSEEQRRRLGDGLPHEGVGGSTPLSEPDRL